MESPQIKVHNLSIGYFIDNFWVQYGTSCHCMVCILYQDSSQVPFFSLIVMVPSENGSTCWYGLIRRYGLDGACTNLNSIIVSVLTWHSMTKLINYRSYYYVMQHPWTKTAVYIISYYIQQELLSIHLEMDYQWSYMKRVRKRPDTEDCMVIRRLKRNLIWIRA